MYKIIDKINENTFIAVKSSRIFILKKIYPEDVEIYRKIKGIKSKYCAAAVGFTEQNGSLFAVIDYIQGDTLSNYIAENGALSDDETKRFAVQICLGLKELHRNGIIHRDINPDNVVIDNYKNAVIIDYGISRTYKDSQKTDTQILGTKGYAAPEQFGFSQTSCRSDIYSVGVLINFMKTGKLPLEKKAQGVFSKIIGKCTEIDEYKRYADIDSLLCDIDSKEFKKSARLIKIIPGFQNDIMWQRVISGIYYIFSLLFTVIIIVTDIKNSALLAVCDFFALAFFLWGVPAALFSAYSLADIILPPGSSKAKRILIKAMSAVVCAVISLIFIYIQTLFNA